MARWVLWSGLTLMGLAGIVGAALSLGLATSAEARDSGWHADPAPGTPVNVGNPDAGVTPRYTLPRVHTTAHSKDGEMVTLAANGFGLDTFECYLACGASSPPQQVEQATAVPRQTAISPGEILAIDLYDFTSSGGNVIADNSTTLEGITVSNNPAGPFSLPTGDSNQFLPYHILVPIGTTPGTKTVLVTESGGGGTRSATFTLSVVAPPSGQLTLMPATAVAGQTIAISGTGFTPVSIPGGAGPGGVHQITGNGTVVVTLNGVPLPAANIQYPINLDSNGGFVATIVLPVDAATLVSGNRSIVVTHSGGRVGTELGPGRWSRGRYREFLPVNGGSGARGRGLGGGKSR